MIKIGFTLLVGLGTGDGSIISRDFSSSPPFQIDGSLLFSDDRQLSLNSSSFDKCLQEDQDESIVYISFQIDDEWVTQDGQDFHLIIDLHVWLSLVMCSL